MEHTNKMCLHWIDWFSWHAYSVLRSLWYISYCAKFPFSMMLAYLPKLQHANELKSFGWKKNPIQYSESEPQPFQAVVATIRENIRQPHTHTHFLRCATFNLLETLFGVVCTIFNVVEPLFGSWHILIFTFKWTLESIRAMLDKH